MARERTRGRQQRHPTQLPQQAAIEVIRADPTAGRGYDFGPQPVFPDERCRPGLAALLPVDPPDLLAGRGVERGEKRLGRVVVQDKEPVVVERGGRRGRHRLHRVERPGILGPQDLAVEIERHDHADGTEIHVDPFAVGDRCLRRVAVLEVPRDCGHRAVQLSRPPDRPGLEVDIVDHPAVLAAGGHRTVMLARVVEPRYGLDLVIGGADGGGDEDVVVPDDRRAPAQPGDVDLPGDVVGLAPGVRQRGVVSDVARVHPSKPRPLLCRTIGGDRQQQRHHKDGDYRDASHRSPPFRDGGVRQTDYFITSRPRTRVDARATKMTPGGPTPSWKMWSAAATPPLTDTVGVCLLYVL